MHVVRVDAHLGPRPPLGAPRHTSVCLPVDAFIWPLCSASVTDDDDDDYDDGGGNAARNQRLPC